MSDVEGVTAEETTAVESVENNTPEKVETPTVETENVEADAPEDNTQESEETELDYKSEYEKLKADKAEADIKISRQKAANKAQQERYEEAIAERKKLQSELLSLKKPDINDFETQEEYDKASSDYDDKRVDLLAEDKAQELETQKAEAEKYQQAQTSFQEKEAEVIASNPDYQENTAVVQEYIDMIPKDENGVVQDAGFQEFSKFLAFECDNGPALLNHLGKNPDKIESLLGKPPALIKRKLMAYEKELSVPKTPAPKTDPLPTPINKAKGSATTRPNAKTLADPDAYMKWRNSQKKQRS